MNNVYGSNINDEQKEILSLVSKFGCLNIEQVKVLMEPNSEKDIVMLINGLVKDRMLSIVNQKYLIPFGDKDAFNISTISCLWVMMKISSKEEIKESMKAEPPSQIFFTSKRTESYELMYIDESNLYKLKALQEKYDRRNSMNSKLFENTYNVLVIDHESSFLIPKLKEYNLQFPFLLALVSQTSTGKPSIKFLKSQPKKVQN